MTCLTCTCSPQRYRPTRLLGQGPRRGRRVRAQDGRHHALDAGPPMDRLPAAPVHRQAPFHRLPFTGSFGSPFCCSRSQASSTPARARSTIHGAGASGRTRGSLPRSSSCSGTRPSYGAPRGVRCGTTRCNTRGSRSRSMRSSPWRNSGQDTSNRWTRRRGVRTRRSCSSCAAGAPSDAIRRSMQRP